MIWWRYCLVLAMLLLLPARIHSKSDEDDEEGRGDENDEDDDDDEEDEDEESEKPADPAGAGGRRAPVFISSTKSIIVTRTAKRRPLECYVCAYKSETLVRACLDPTKFRVHTITCHSSEDRCFTSVISKGSVYEAVVRGCRSSCVGSPETTCCELNRCNNQAFAMPQMQPLILTTSTATKSLPQSVLFFVTILLVLQTVVKVAIV